MHLFHIENGSGVPLVLLHGFPFDHMIWRGVIREIKNGIWVIAPDLRGHGSSEVVENDYLTADMAADVIELLDHLHIKKAVIAGHSMGGYIALDLARNYPERVSGLILIASHIYADTQEKKRSRYAMMDEIRKRSAQEVLANMPRKLSNNEDIRKICQETVAKMDSKGAVGALHAMANRESSEQVWEKFTNPTMVIAGSDDQFIPIEKSRGFATLPKESALEEIKGVGHMPMLEAPKVVAKVLFKFINTLWRN